ncbi:hypothetical protein SAMN05421819_0375 [Bryocella elongata]|uniref:Lipoprotein n=1 Tax=Bryocella elongata TaxID=863522 RepID=A0A1H5SXS5_9BACT|nr:hypothetical protein [Bryocella elongata]SEF54661.1 hypothetical protein SAMN05421819_0375 [Bryocella elongata]
MPRLTPIAATFAALALTACSSAPSPQSQPAPTKPAAPAVQYPARPTIAPPAFKVFHQDAMGITLVAPENATDEQISAIVWQLRDAAHDHSFDQLHISQKLVDARDPIEWFHIYRGSKCASEKFTQGPLPCGHAYHVAGEFTLGSFHDKDHNIGSLVHDENHQTPLWDPNTPNHS